MKKNLHKVVTGIAALAMAASLSLAVSAEDNEVVIATSGSPNPFTYIDENDEITGYEVEVIKEVFNRLPQYASEMTVTDWSSIFAGLDADKFQVAVNNISYNDERAEKYLYTKPILKQAYILAVAEDTDDITCLADLEGKTTEVDPDTTYTAFLEDYNAAHGNTIEMNYSDEDLLLALQNIESGKYDFYLIDDALFNFYCLEYGLKLKAVVLEDEEISQLTPPYSYVLVSKGNDQLVEDINGVLAEMVEDETMKTLSEKFFGSDLTPYDSFEE